MSKALGAHSLSIMSTRQSQTIEDRLDPARAEAWCATLGLKRPVGVGQTLPLFSHHAFFWEPSRRDQLGDDGHSIDGLARGLSDLPVRMWAGGHVTWHAPFRSGVAAKKTTRAVAVTRKSGRSGQLDFVTLRHEIHQRGALVLSEDQELVFREEGSRAADKMAATGEADERRALKLDLVTLFQFSALTFNAHRIHYDADYARALGYDGVVVHGPLLAAVLAGFAEDHFGALNSFSFRAHAPLVLGEVAWLCRAGTQLWVEGARRGIAMTAEAA